MSDLIAEIAVNAPLKQLFSYHVPEDLVAAAQIGVRVKVPFGRRTSTGFLIELRTGDATGLKELKTVLDDQPLLNTHLIRLLRWAADYYCHPVGQVIRNALPGSLGSEKVTTKILYEPLYRFLKMDTVRGQKQREILEYISDLGEVGLEQLRQQFPAPYAVLQRLVELGLVEEEQQEKNRDPFKQESLPKDKCLTLNKGQEDSVSSIIPAIHQAAFKPFLLHGVTGSGKTEVYLRVVEECLGKGKHVLVMVPEIALTPQLVGRFRARFEARGQIVAVLHSGLSDGERYDAWRKIHQGESQIVIGARSAVFAPIEKLGLIIVDEEHEASYKQAEGFRYNARDLALVRGQQQACPVVLGSATPSLASYYRSEQGGVQLLTLPKRVHAGAMPEVELLDLSELKPETVLANPLIEAIQLALEKREQVLLLLNRRGYAPFLICTDCGESFHCPNCEITLTYHQHDKSLRCHYCDFHDRPKEVCPKCRGGNIEAEGAGTERLEEEIRQLFPTARIARMDRDTTSCKGSHQRLVGKMLNQELDILIGTQMIAKGHDFPGVSLVGVLATDNLLNLPDFRAAERSFTLLTQVAGRAGRATGGGKVLIQTYNPQHYALACAAKQTFAEFYNLELPFRRELGYPPCGHLVNLIFSGNSQQQVKKQAEKLAKRLLATNLPVEVLGPSPCPLARLRGKSRYQILLKATERTTLRTMLDRLKTQENNIQKGIRLSIDVDPVDML